MQFYKIINVYRIVEKDFMRILKIYVLLAIVKKIFII